MHDLGAEPVGASHRLRNVFACRRCSKEVPVNDRLAHSVCYEDPRLLLEALPPPAERLAAYRE
eukprot:13608212-Alexandrium_andersonii.AAC.1